MKNEFDPTEKEFLQDVRSVMANVRMVAGPCPHPDLLMAARAGVQTVAAEGVLRHLALCSVCRQLAEDLVAHEYPGASAEEDRRIRARWKSHRSWNLKRKRRSAQPQGTWKPGAMAATAA